jgi:selenocysteine lyase/cysteine desulfurase
MDGLEELGIEPITTRNPDMRGGIVSFETPDASEVARELTKDGVNVWGRDGRVRVSPHLYNTELEIARFFEHLQNVIMRLGRSLQ